MKSGDIIQFGKGGITASVQITREPEQAHALYSSGFTEAQTLQGIAYVNSQIQLPNSISTIGFGTARKIEADERPIGNYIAAGIAIFAFVFLGLIVAGILFLSLGPVAAVIAAFVAFLPAVFYLMPLGWLDRFDPEPLWLLGSAFAWGALVAVFVSLIINSLLGAIFGEFVGAVVSAPIFEEGSKGLGLLILLMFFRRYFDGILDGVIFGGVIALGFATVENVLYYGSALLGEGIPGVAALFVLRGILSPFAHVTFTAMTGIGCGVSRESHNVAVRVLAPFAGYICAVLLHGVWNFVAVIGGVRGFLLVYIVLELPFFLIFSGFTFYIMYRQNNLLKEMLAIDVARGLIAQEHLDIATSAFRSFTWVWAGAGDGKYLSRPNFFGRLVNWA